MDRLCCNSKSMIASEECSLLPAKAYSHVNISSCSHLMSHACENIDKFNTCSHFELAQSSITCHREVIFSWECESPGHQSQHIIWRGWLEWAFLNVQLCMCIFIWLHMFICTCICIMHTHMRMHFTSECTLHLHSYVHLIVHLCKCACQYSDANAFYMYMIICIMHMHYAHACILAYACVQSNAGLCHVQWWNQCV